MEEEYIVELRITADKEEIEKHIDVPGMLFDTMSEVPFSFDIEDCRRVGSK